MANSASIASGGTAGLCIEVAADDRVVGPRDPVGSAAAREFAQRTAGVARVDDALVVQSTQRHR